MMVQVRTAVQNQTLAPLTLSVMPNFFRPFTLALIQLGSIGLDKVENLRHARKMILKASLDPEGKKPDIIVLPVRRRYGFCLPCTSSKMIRNASTHPMDTHISERIQKKLVLRPEVCTTSQKAQAKA
jgi:hypothetical protein